MSFIWIIVIAVSLKCVDMFPMYKDLIPNGRNVFRNRVMWPAVGHEDRSPGVTPGQNSQLTHKRNKFGLAFQRERAWTRALCQEDSDGDGQSNGLELGDPYCTWSPNGGYPERQSDISHPGFNDSMTKAIMVVLTTDSTASTTRLASESTTVMPTTTARTTTLLSEDSTIAPAAETPATFSAAARAHAGNASGALHCSIFLAIQVFLWQLSAIISPCA